MPNTLTTNSNVTLTLPASNTPTPGVTWTANCSPTSIYTLGPIIGGGANSPKYTLSSASSAVTVNGTVSADEVLVDGQSVKEMLETLKVLQDRLAILIPDPNKLEKFAALKAAYEHYKLLEKLCTENPPDGT